jgi:hypothetical protein
LRCEAPGRESDRLERFKRTRREIDDFDEVDALIVIAFEDLASLGGRVNDVRWQERIGCGGRSRNHRSTGIDARSDEAALRDFRFPVPHALEVAAHIAHAGYGIGDKEQKLRAACTKDERACPTIRE